MEYRKEIDGLRAVAVVPVVLFHGNFGLLPGGYVGVDVFFVISGYLITSIILDDLEAGRFSITRFYERRVRRIFPALFLVLAACLPVAWRLLAPGDMTDFCESLVAVPLFCSNVLFWSESGYFDTAAELKPLLHTWSLAVEEQFYVLFPLLLWSLRRSGRWLMCGILSALAAVSFAIAVWGVRNQPSAAFFLLPTRAWELLLGCIVAVQTRRRLPSSPPLAEACGAAGLLMIVGAMLGFDAHTPMPSVATLAPTVGTALVIAFANAKTLVGRLLSLPPVVGVGLISYSVYLWHQPLFVFARHASIEKPGILLSAGLALASFGLGYLSWLLVERPFRSWKSLPTTALFGMAIAGSVAFIAFGVGGVKTAGYADRENFTITAIPGYVLDNDVFKSRTETPIGRVTGTKNYPVFGSPADRDLWFKAPEPTVKILIIGNSHSIDMFNAFASNAELFPSMDFARYGMQVSDVGHPEGEAFFESPNYRAADIVLISTRWSNFRFEARSRGRSDFDGLKLLIPRVRGDGKVLALCSENPQFPQFGNLTLADSIVIKWSRLYGNAPPAPGECIDSINREYFESRDDDSRVVQTNRTLQRIAGEHGLPLLDKQDLICDERRGQCTGVLEDGRKAFWDAAHFTLDGARAFGRRAAEIGWLDPAVRAVDPVDR